ncbi:MULTISPECIES: efflux RND transporter periplasmic adaptor subunit [unclassified Exiguobacterium]|uniref:efflux RND transporter periplasmic adaptor subunit n=1 Tax=unclassified Exiguobacterium TaxID=2644629 RepID=UPI0008B7D303|nr:MULTISPECIES: hypothetical protein [unclassified Exiguobacterium]OGX78753.1 hypothetical protein A6395_10455 [Exiguobacterium sp. SH31]TCI24308.1 hypothetical protein EVJ32_14760 [Exiguobacterium sp. SH5S4]TCI34059.1 hypothetical protein EVJ29_12605 [Exiguobacterium sp. SH4S7]TCI59392.1 hypothetical protein EVJ21_13710 [Exiguobacterium sp. SH0S2]TCI61762.1 hypothetical protein EVJ26_09380 [Exiguobacterium sp. SH3S1]
MNKKLKWGLGGGALAIALGAGIFLMPQSVEYKSEQVATETIENVYTFAGQVTTVGEDATGRLLIDERDLGKVEEGDALTIYANALDTELEGTVESIADEAEALTTPGSSARYAMNVTLPETDGLRNGMTLEGSIVVERVEEAETLSLDSITFEEGDAYVYVEGTDGPVKRQVELGISDGSRVEIKDGLDEDSVLLMDEATAGGIMPPQIGGGQ